MSAHDRRVDTHTEIRHLLRTLKTALELAITARAPDDLLDRLARPAALLEAAGQLPPDVGAVETLLPGWLADGRAAIDRWDRWASRRTPRA
jgi:hypothetical protein